ncbi:hypothetical protein B0H14DRAFT_2765421 [Mycena olivaceomarginata]|nr:hypothetical protein B0H14DRAFT_2765421 [Mycena olivaceomarginata]
MFLISLCIILPAVVSALLTLFSSHPPQPSTCTLALPRSVLSRSRLFAHWLVFLGVCSEIFAAIHYLWSAQ